MLLNWFKVIFIIRYYNMNKFEINIGLFGCISTGKTTFLNAISGQQYSDTEIKKTTMVPQIYMENEELKSNAQIIRRLNREINESVMKLIDVNNFSLRQCQPLYHFVDKICDLFDLDTVNDNMKINIYDIPGLNDAASKNIYFEWVKQNIKLFDIVIFMTDINRGLNSLEEIEILHLLMKSMKTYGFKMICLMNKCDDIYYDHEQDDLIFEENEQENIYIHANNILVDIAKLYDINPEDNLFTPFFPISSENCFIYRALKKNPLYPLDQVHQNRLCKNECGTSQWKKMSDDEKSNMFNKIILNLDDTFYSKILDTGYLTVRNLIRNTITQNKSNFILKHTEKKLFDLENIPLDNLSIYMDLIKNYINEISYIQSCNISTNITYDNLWKIIKKSITNYVNNITRINSNILQNKYLMEFNKFENLHSIIQMACVNIQNLNDLIITIPDYPKEFINNCLGQLVNKLLDIYNQLCLVTMKNYVHIFPANLKNYLEFIKTFCPNQFENYAFKFLDIICNSESKHYDSHQQDMFNLLIYLANNVENIDACYSLINVILINKQLELSNMQSEFYFQYLIQLKKILGHYRQLLPLTLYTPLDILYEVTTKSLSNYLGTNNIATFFGYNLDHQKIDTHINYFYDKPKHFINIDHANKLFELYVQKKIDKKND